MVDIATNAAGLVVVVLRSPNAVLVGDVLTDGPSTFDQIAAVWTVADLPADFFIGSHTYDGAIFQTTGASRAAPPDRRTPDQVAIDAAADRVRTARNSAQGADPVTWAELDDVLTASGIFPVDV